MDSEFTIKIAGLIIAGLGTLFLGLLTWGIKALISTVISTRDQLVVVNHTIRNLVEDAKALPKMKEDLNLLHQKVRDLEGAE